MSEMEFGVTVCEECGEQRWAGTGPCANCERKATAEEKCRYPCDCGQFPEEHCSCMEGHAASEPADQTRADVVLSHGDRCARCGVSAGQIAAEHAAEVEALRRDRDKARDAAKIATESARRRRARAEAAEATVARVTALADEWGHMHLTGFCDGCDRLARGNRDRFVADLRAALDGERP